MMESQQIEKTKQSIDQRRQKLQLIKTRLQKKLQNKSMKAELQQKSNNSKTLINHLNINSNLFQQNKSSQFYQSKDVTKFPQPDKTFQFNSTLFKHLDKNQSQNKSKFQNTSSQFFRDNGDINSYLRANQNQIYNYSQNKSSPKKDRYLEKQPERDSSQMNPSSLNLFSQYDKFLQQINTNAKLPVKQIKKHLQKKQGHLKQDHPNSNLNIKGLSSTHNIPPLGFENFNDNNLSLTSLNQDEINNLITANRNIKLTTNRQAEGDKFAYNQKQKEKQKIKLKEAQLLKKQTDKFKKEQKKRFLEHPFGQSTLSLKIHKKNQSSQAFFKPTLPPHPDKSSRTQLNSDKKQTHSQRQLVQNSGESVDLHKERLKLMLSEKKKNYQSCVKLDMDDSIQYDLSQDQQDIQQKNKKQQKQDQKQKKKKIEILQAEKQKLKKQLKQIDNELEHLQSQI